MIGNRAPASPARSAQGPAWALPLLIVATLCGLLAMHGLGAAPPPPPEAGAAAQAHGAMRHSAPMTATGGDQAGGHRAGSGGHGEVRGQGPDSRLLAGSSYAFGQCECDGTDGHVGHADPTCSASGTSGAPAMDDPAASTTTGHQPAAGLESCRPRTGGERVPPSLHRLQLLRI